MKTKYLLYFIALASFIILVIVTFFSQKSFATSPTPTPSARETTQNLINNIAATLPTLLTDISNTKNLPSSLVSTLSQEIQNDQSQLPTFQSDLNNAQTNKQIEAVRQQIEQATRIFKVLRPQIKELIVVDKGEKVIADFQSAISILTPVVNQLQQKGVTIPQQWNDLINTQIPTATNDYQQVITTVGPLTPNGYNTNPSGSVTILQTGSTTNKSARTALQTAKTDLLTIKQWLNQRTLKGICQFTGTTDATNQYIQCGALNYFWSNIEPTKGTFNWAPIDNDIAMWSAQNKKVVIRITMSGNCYLNQPGSCQRTPQWVLNEMQQANANQVMVKDTNNGIHPVYWNPAFISEWTAFIDQFASRYDGNPNIIAINAVHGNDGELRVDALKNWPSLTAMTTAWQADGYSDQVWLQTLNTLTSIFINSFHKTPLAMQAGEPFLQKSMTEYQFLVTTHSTYPTLWLQDDGLTSSSTKPALWQQIPHIEEQLESTKTTGDTLQGDIQNALNLGANYIFIYTSDINNPNNQSVLQWAASQVQW